MRSKIFSVTFFLVGVAFCLSSFSASAQTSGGVKVTVTLEGKPVSGALVGLASSDENRENSDYLAEEETNASGVYTFSGLKAGTYYLDAFVTDENDEGFWAEVEVTVASTIVPVTMKLITEEEFMEE